ncbi:MAG: hypothetical protein DYG92_14330 [Leptolyngbya sp. PLA1]|nr:hypothetical protein [Leptolyngbya sp. PLA1]
MMATRRTGARGWVTAVLGLLACVLLARALASAGEVRQSGVRAVKVSLLRSAAMAAAVYRDEHRAEPGVEDLARAGLIDVVQLREFLLAEPVGGRGSEGPTPLLVQAAPCRAVRKGEAWGGPGETIDRDLPACRHVLMSDWSVVAMDEDAYQRDWAGRVALKVLR